MTTLQPSDDNSLAVAAPTPLLEPVIIATLSVKSFTLF
jgi:hypothetical protein